MAGVLTDQSIGGNQVAPLALTTTAAQPQFLNNGKFGRTGNATVPIPGSGRSTKRRVRVSVIATVTTGATNTVTLNIQLNGVTYATSGARTLNTKTGVFYFYAEFLYDPLAANLSGQLGGHTDNTLITAAPLGTSTNIAFANEGNVAGLTVSVANADAAAVFTLDELAVEVY